MNEEAVHTYFKEMRRNLMRAARRGVKFPCSTGAMLALRSYEHSLKIGTPFIECTERPVGEQIKDYSDTMKAAGVTYFVITGEKSGSVSLYSGLVDEGWLWMARLVYTHLDGEEIVGAKVGLCTSASAED